jgi:hypothetical protein
MSGLVKRPAELDQDTEGERVGSPVSVDDGISTWYRRGSGWGDHAMTSITTKPELSQPETETAVHLFDNWFDTIEAGHSSSSSLFDSGHLVGVRPIANRLTTQ